MQIYFRVAASDSKTGVEFVELELGPSETVAILKQAIHFWTGIPPEIQRHDIGKESWDAPAPAPPPHRHTPGPSTPSPPSWPGPAWPSGGAGPGPRAQFGGPGGRARARKRRGDGDPLQGAGAPPPGFQGQ